MAYEPKTALVGVHDPMVFGNQSYTDFVDTMGMVIKNVGYAVTTTYGLPATLEAAQRKPFELYVVEINLDQPRALTSEPIQQVLAAARMHNPKARVIGITGTDDLARDAKHIEGVLVSLKGSTDLIELIESLSL